MPNIEKAYAITDARISFVSLVDKAANKKRFIITKSDDGSADFTTYGKILKADADSHYVTGIVYEPMVEDSQGNYMTEAEITKAAYWFAKNGKQVDLQHCFQKCDGVEVVESYVAKCDMEIEGEKIKKGTWLMTMEVNDDSVWDSIQKGDISGFSMGGMGVFSDEDVALPVEKQGDEPKGLLRRLAKAMGFDVVEKPKPVAKEGKSLSSKNLNTLKGIYDTLGSFLSDFDTDSGEGESGAVQKEDTMTPEDMKKLVGEEIAKAMEPIAKQLEALAKGDGEGETPTPEPTPEPAQAPTTEDIAKTVGEEVAKAMEPVTKQLEALMKSRALPGNLNDAAGNIQKQEPHYMTGMF